MQYTRLHILADMKVCLDVSHWPVWLLPVCAGVPAGAPRVYPGHLGSLNRRAWQSAWVQVAICLPKNPTGQLLPYHALPLQRLLLQHRNAAGLWVWQRTGVESSSDTADCDLKLQVKRHALFYHVNVILKDTNGRDSVTSNACAIGYDLFHIMDVERRWEKEEEEGSRSMDAHWNNRSFWEKDWWKHKRKRLIALLWC